jgi:hypothetical protein
MGRRPPVRPASPDLGLAEVGSLLLPGCGSSKFRRGTTPAVSR